MDLLARAEIVARLAHAGQVDKRFVNYVEHLKAVAAMVEGYEAKQVAWLHDIIEDTPLSLHDLQMLGFSKRVVDAVRLLTHTHEHSHPEYIELIRDARTSGAELARQVKRADLRHNSDPARALPGDHGWMTERYAKAMAILGE